MRKETFNTRIQHPETLRKNDIMPPGEAPVAPENATAEQMAEFEEIDEVNNAPLARKRCSG